MLGPGALKERHPPGVKQVFLNGVVLRIINMKRRRPWEISNPRPPGAPKPAEAGAPGGKPVHVVIPGGM